MVLSKTNDGSGNSLNGELPLLAGALGNFIDRLRLGAVIDLSISGSGPF